MCASKRRFAQASTTFRIADCLTPSHTCHTALDGFEEVEMALARLGTAVAAFMLAATPALAQDKVRFQTDWMPSGEHAMYYGGWQKGIFAAEGIDITITRGYGSGDTVTKLAGGGVRLRRRRHGRRHDGTGAPERAGQDHRRALHPVAALAVRAEELRHHQFQGARRQEDRHHAGQQPQVLFPEGRREVRAPIPTRSPGSTWTARRWRRS